MTSSLTFNSKTQPNAALSLPKGMIIWEELEAEFSEKNVTDCAKLLIQNKVFDQEFETQAAIIVYAADNFNWGEVRGVTAAQKLK